MLERFDNRKSFSRQGNKNSMLEPFSGSNQVNQINRRDDAFNRNNGVMDIFSMHNQMIKQMDQRFEKVQNRMMKNFEHALGGGFMKEFISPMNMMSQISSQMDRMFSDFSDLHHNVMGNREQGPFTKVQRVIAMQSKMGPDNKVYSEKYFSNSVAQKDQTGNTISERQQAYKNTSNRRDVIAQERMLNNQGRKFVQERVNGQTSSTNHYFNMEENDADHFDNMWNDLNERMGFYRNNSNLLGIGSGGSMVNQNRLRNQQDDYDEDSRSNWSAPKTQTKFQRKPFQNQQRQNNKNYKEYNFKDEGRRGDFLPINARNENQPVRLNNNFNGYGRRETDLQPTQPQGENRPSITALPASQSQIPAQNNNNVGSNVNIRNNVQNSNQQRGSATLPPRQQINAIPARKAAEPGVFINRNNPKGALPKAG